MLRATVLFCSVLFSLPLWAIESLVRQSPFVATRSVAVLLSPGEGPTQNRQKELLEQFDLSHLSYVGLIQQGPKKWGLIQDEAGQVHSIHVGSYMGKSDGKVIAIQPEKIVLEQWLPQNQGQFQKESVELSLK